MEHLVSWKKRRDKFQDSDNVSMSSDQVNGFAEREDVGLTGSPKNVSFIFKDETNATAMKRMKMKRWF